MVDGTAVHDWVHQGRVMKSRKGIMGYIEYLNWMTNCSVSSALDDAFIEIQRENYKNEAMRVNTRYSCIQKTYITNYANLVRPINRVDLKVRLNPLLPLLSHIS